MNMSRIPTPAVPIKPSARKAAVRGQLEVAPVVWTVSVPS